MTKLELALSCLEDIAEGDCHYGDNCPTFGSRHGQCISCKARKALEEIRELKEPEEHRCGTCGFFRSSYGKCNIEIKSIGELCAEITVGEYDGADCDGWKARKT